MREIKFRAWDHGMFQNVIVSADGSWTNDLRRDVWHSGNVMQFTELKDKNGKEIYESDTFKWGNDTGVVIFERGCFVFKVGDNYSMTMRDHYPEEIEVIGNIYETLI